MESTLDGLALSDNDDNDNADEDEEKSEATITEDILSPQSETSESGFERGSVVRRSSSGVLTRSASELTAEGLRKHRARSRRRKRSTTPFSGTLASKVSL